MTAEAPAERPRAGQLHHVVVNVRDLDRSVAFYRDVLGLVHDGDADVGGPHLARLVRLAPGTTGRMAFLSAGRGMGRIELVEWAPGDQDVWPEGNRTGRTPGPAILSFLLREGELRAMYDAVRTDHPCWSEPVSFDVSGSTLLAFVVEDPDGNPVEFFALSASGD